MASLDVLLDRTDLHEYQEQAISFATLGEQVGLFLSPGLGKTIISLTTIVRCQDEGNAWLIVCPLRVMDVWEDEIKAWRYTQHLTAVRLHGPKREERLKEKADIYLINYELLSWLHGKLKKCKGRTAPFRNIILDESQRIKSHSTKRWKKFRHMVPMFDRRILLTGTPLGGGGLEGLWTQMFILDRGKTLDTAFTRFRERFFRLSGYNLYNWEPKEGTEEALWRLVGPRCLSMRAIDKLDMPELTRNIIKVPLPTKARKLYTSTEDDFYLELGDNVVIPPTAAVVSMKLRQITQGGAFDEEGTWHDLHDAKITALLRLIDELQGTPLIVLYQFKGELAALQNQLPEAPVIAGGVTPTQSAQIVTDFNADRVPVLLAHPRSVALGLNLQKGTAHNICWLAPTWSLEDHIQAEARLWRQGQDRGVIVHHIVAENTIDHAVMRALTSKDATQSSLLDALRSHRRIEHV